MSDGEFAGLFRLYSEIHETIGAILAAAADRDSGIDPDQVVKELTEKYPALEQSSLEIREAVIQAATDAGVPIHDDGHAVGDRPIERRRPQA